MAVAGEANAAPALVDLRTVSASAVLALNNANHVETSRLDADGYAGLLGAAGFAVAVGNSPDAFLIAFDEASVHDNDNLAWFRQRHARMVERMIGRRTGTGGSAGVDYLDQTALKYRVFRDIWAVRTLLVREGELPTLERPDFYGFAAS